MANINTAEIEGFGEMTAEEQVSALLGFEIPERVDLSGYVKKEVFDKKAAEAANLSKQLKGKMTAEEQAAEAQKAALEEQQERVKQIEAEYQTRMQELQELNAKLTRDSNISKYTAELTKLEMDGKTAAETAEAFCDGDIKKVIAGIAAFKKALEKSLEAKYMKDMRQPNGSTGGANGEESLGIKVAKALTPQANNNSGYNPDILAKYKGRKT